MIELSVWEKESFFKPVDVVIAGSGFVGLWCAYYLKKRNPSRSVTILERGLIPTGASTRNAGFACFGSLTELVADAQKMGEDRMLELVEMRYKGLKKITKVFPEKALEFERHGGYELITGKDGSPAASNDLRSDIDRINRQLKKITKRQKTFRLRNEKIPAFGFAGIDHLIGNEAEAQLHSGKLCQSLLSLVMSMGVTVFNNVEIRGFETINGRIELRTQYPLVFNAAQLLVCTNAFARQLLPELDIEPVRGQILVSSPIDDLPFKGTFHFDEGYYYFRNLGDRVLLGGARNKAFEEETTGSMETTIAIQTELERFLSEVILPGRTYSIDYRWSGTMGMGSEKWPIVRPVSDRIFCAVRMSGMGVALAPVIGQKVEEMMTGVS